MQKRSGRNVKQQLVTANHSQEQGAMNKCRLLTAQPFLIYSVQDPSLRERCCPQWEGLLISMNIIKIMPH